jgi:hypothetical protein
MHNRFRQDYRLERKLLATLREQPDDLERERENEKGDGLSSTTISCYKSGLKYHRISRVVVLHEDILETFYEDKIGEQIKPNIGSDKSCLLTDNEFFDNDNFWSGSITWF